MIKKLILLFGAISIFFLLNVSPFSFAEESISKNDDVEIKTTSLSESENTLLSPLKQFKSGIPLNEIKCKQIFSLIQKIDGTPACVKSEIIPKIIERNWGIVSTFCLDNNGNHRNDLVLVPIKKVFKIGEYVKADIINCGSESFRFGGTDFGMMIESIDGSIIEYACVAGEGLANIHPYGRVPWKVPWQSPPCDHSKIIEGEYWLYLLEDSDSKGKFKIKFANP